MLLYHSSSEVTELTTRVDSDFATICKGVKERITFVVIEESNGMQNPVYAFLPPSSGVNGEEGDFHQTKD